MRRTVARLCKATAPSIDAIREVTCRELGLQPDVVGFLETALKEDLTVPFVARYRRHLTGGLNETQVEKAFDTIVEVRNVFAGREKMLADLTTRNLLSAELKARIDAATTMAQLEALYHPFRVTRKTNAAKAREAGLDKYATEMLTQESPMNKDFFKLSEDDMGLVQAVVVEGLSLVPAVLEMAEKAMHQAALVVNFAPKGRKNAVKDLSDEEFAKRQKVFRNYDGKVYRSQGSLEAHNILAIFRGETQGFLKANFETRRDLERELHQLMLNAYPTLRNRMVSRQDHRVTSFIQQALANAVKEHVLPHAERLVRSELKKRAENESLQLFRRNLRRLLTQRPLRGHVLLAVDPGLGNGCKWAILSPQGDVLKVGKFFLTTLIKDGIHTSGKIGAELQELRYSILEHNVTRIAVGDGTASYEAETAVIRLVNEDTQLKTRGIEACRCSEHGASIYSASEAAKEELGHLDLLYRSAVSIGRRVLDPLSEHVKIPVQSLGVGLYQHDIAERQLTKSLTEAAVSVVAQVGIDINTASKHVLAKVPGLNEKLAQNIVNYRAVVGQVKDRQALQNVPGVTKATFLKVAGFIRVPNSSERLDDTSVHPETYAATRKMLTKAGVSLASDSWGVVAEKLCAAFQIPSLTMHRAMQPAIAVAASGQVPVVVPSFPSGDDLPLVDLPHDRAVSLAKAFGVEQEQVTQILSALCAPRVDPREDFNYAGLFTKEYRSVATLRTGQRLLGRVLNVVRFGAWLDVGVEVTGFVHASALIDEDGQTLQVSPLDVIAPCDIVTCVVIEAKDESRPGERHHDHNVKLTLNVVVPKDSLPDAVRQRHEVESKRRAASPPRDSRDAARAAQPPARTVADASPVAAAAADGGARPKRRGWDAEADGPLGQRAAKQHRAEPVVVAATPSVPPRPTKPMAQATKPNAVPVTKDEEQDDDDDDDAPLVQVVAKRGRIDL